MSVLLTVRRLWYSPGTGIFGSLPVDSKTWRDLGTVVLEHGSANCELQAKQPVFV